MHNLIFKIANLSSETEAFIFAITLFICWNIENIAGLTLGYKKWDHAYLNAKFVLTNLPIQVLLGFVYARTMQWTGAHHFGLAYYLPFQKNNFLTFLFVFLFLDLGEYVYHVVMHKVKVLWGFHMVHHSDNNVDVSTTLREHPGENTIRNIFTLLWVFLGGVVFWALVLRQIIQILSNLFSHVNYRIPGKINTVLGWLFITPNLHHVHHHFQKPFTDSNYGDVLSIWDRLFGTFRAYPESGVVFGIDAHMDKNLNSKYGSLMKMPFLKVNK